jgi:hypothetical protein
MINILKKCKQQPFLILNRFKAHRNHPGHKQEPLCVPPKFTLPDELTDEPLYPPIKPKYPTCYTFSNDYPPNKAWYYFNEGQKYNSLRTVQERLTVMAYLNTQPTIDDLGVTRIRHYPLLMLNTMPSAAQSSEQRQYITKTMLNPKTNAILAESAESATSSTRETEQAPSNFSDSQIYGNLKNLVINCVNVSSLKDPQASDSLKTHEHKDSYKPDSIKFEETLKSIKEKNNLLTNNIFNAISAYLAGTQQEKYSHFNGAQYGRNVNIEAYWKRCGYKETNARGCIKPDDDTIRYQFKDKALYQIKTDMPLRPVRGFWLSSFDRFFLKLF